MNKNIDAISGAPILVYSVVNLNDEPKTNKSRAPIMVAK